LLEFAPDSESLYFTTTLVNAVQSYSLREARLLEPAPTHNSAPNVLATSPSSHLLLTASESPPTVYLQCLTSGTQPVFLQPHASQTPVVSASFHPERPDIFALAFKDGTLAFYDATQLIQTGPQALRKSHVEGCELAVFKSLHSVVSHHTDLMTESIGSQSRGIAEVSFLTGYKSRGISVGADGKCNIVDFEKSRIIRTWHMKCSATSLSVLSTHSDRKLATRTTARTSRTSSVLPSSTIAIGRTDGKVMFFDGSGALLHEVAVGDNSRRVIDVEWIKGPGPKTLGESEQVQFANETWIELFTLEGTLRSRTSTVRQPRSQSNPKKDRQPQMSGDGSSSSPSLYPQEEFGIGSNDNSFGTVQHHQIRGSVHRDFPAASANDYMDLFSPVKQPGRGAPFQPDPSPARRPTPKRNRPRLSSSTFLDQSRNSVPMEVKGEKEFTLSGALQPSSSPSKAPLPSKRGKEKLASSPIKFKAPTKRSTHVESSQTIGNIRIPAPLQNSYSSLDMTVSSSSTINSKILADIRRFGELGTWSKDTKTSKALLAPYMPTQTGRVTKTRRTSTSRTQTGQRRASAHRKSLINDATRSSRSGKGDVRQTKADDIWLPPESEGEEQPLKTNRLRKRQDSSAKQRSSLQPGGHTWEAESDSSRALNHEVAIPGRRRRSVRLQLATSRVAAGSVLRRAKTTVYPSVLVPQARSPSPSPAESLYSASSVLSLGTETAGFSYSPKKRGRAEHQYTDDTRHPTNADAPFPSAPELPLPPGFAQSYQGPVDVGAYLPRKGSLAFVASPAPSPKRTKTTLSEVSGNKRRRDTNTSVKGQSDRAGASIAHVHEACEDCSELRDEVARLKEEIANLRRMVKGKGRVNG
jgi:hypothetical protein